MTDNRPKGDNMLNSREITQRGLTVPEGTIARMRDLSHMTVKFPDGSMRDYIRVQGRKNRRWMIDAGDTEGD